MIHRLRPRLKDRETLQLKLLLQKKLVEEGKNSTTANTLNRNPLSIIPSIENGPRHETSTTRDDGRAERTTESLVANATSTNNNTTSNTFPTEQLQPYSPKKYSQVEESKFEANASTDNSLKSCISNISSPAERAQKVSSVLEKDVVRNCQILISQCNINVDKFMITGKFN
ncbi:hypothetical protein BY996DRAFT_6426072 [Phakopsora pachyrhizi]|nr:hypothetical protein BY996DRAFT_6426072 [Phakopsora pachyrhizi]